MFVRRPIAVILEDVLTFANLVVRWTIWRHGSVRSEISRLGRMTKRFSEERCQVYCEEHHRQAQEESSTEARLINQAETCPGL